jgi:hypothetical protein
MTTGPSEQAKSEADINDVLVPITLSSHPSAKRKTTNAVADRSTRGAAVLGGPSTSWTPCALSQLIG